MHAPLNPDPRAPVGDAPEVRAPSLRDPSFLAETLVGASIRHPWLTIVLALVLTALGAYVTATRFAITTQTDQLIESDADWVHQKNAYERAFPQFSKPMIVAVIDGDTPEQAEAAAARFAERLTEVHDPSIAGVHRPDGGRFFYHNGLLLLPLEEVEATTGGLVRQQGTLLALYGDPTLRGLLRILALGAERGELAGQGRLLDRISDTVERVLRGERAQLSWQTLTSDRPPDPRQLRKFVLIDPVLDFKALEPASNATRAVRLVAADAGLTPDNGVRMRLTGFARLADEEFSTIREGAPLHLGITAVAIALILYLALKSGRLIAAVLLTTVAGLVMTIGAGLLMVGRFNVISVAVAALFLGLGVDFGIQVAVRYRDERFRLDRVRPAMRLTAKGIGWSLTLAALSLLAGFFSFLPTQFRGVSELGLITGVGMIIAFVLSLTLLPALIVLMRPAGERDTVELPALAAVDRWILGHRKIVIGATVLVVLAGIPLLLRIQFDANPMHLRSAETEAVSTFLDLTSQPGQTPNTLSVLAPSLPEARTLAARLAALPEVAQVVTLASFVPERQAEKQALIKAAAGEFEVLFDPPMSPEPESDADTVAQLRTTAMALRGEPGKDAGEAAATRLAGVLDRLAEASPDRRAAAESALVGTLPALFSRIRALLSPDEVTLDTLPAELRRDWITPDGKARIEVSPAGDANDNAVLERFSAAVRSIAPVVSGPPIDIVEAGHVVATAFVIAGTLALVTIFLLLSLALRNPKDVALTLGPLVIATVLTLESADLLGMPLNLANVIALPLMLAVGVNFHIYYMIAWRNGVADMLASSLTRAIFFSALVTGVAFGSLWLSNHPGTASMGKLLTISLVFTLLAAFIVVPAFLGPPRQEAAPEPPPRPGR